MSNTNDVYHAKVNIPGIPVSVPRDKLIEAFESLGFNTNLISSLEIHSDVLYVKTTAVSPDGRAVIENHETIKHTIAIPITGTV